MIREKTKENERKKHSSVTLSTFEKIKLKKATRCGEVFSFWSVSGRKCIMTHCCMLMLADISHVSVRGGTIEIQSTWRISDCTLSVVLLETTVGFKRMCTKIYKPPALTPERVVSNAVCVRGGNLWIPHNSIRYTIHGS